jgi:hypothetical protein
LATAVNGTAILAELVRSRLRRLPRSTVCAGLGAPDNRHRPARRGPACAGRASRRLSPALTPAQRRRLDFIYGWIRQWIRSGPSELPSREADGLTGRSSTPYHIVVPACRSGGQGGVAALGCICRIRRVTTQGRALRAGGPELDDMNAVITAGRSSWRALIFGRENVDSASGPACAVLRWCGRRVGGLGPGLTSDSADAARAVLRDDLPAGPQVFTAPAGGAGLICPAWTRGRGSRIRAASGCVPSLNL